MVPQTALGSSQLGKYVYVVGKGNKVDQRMVSLGPINGDQVAILSGVSEGDQVITGNLQKIGPGMPVSPLPAETGQLIHKASAMACCRREHRAGSIFLPVKPRAPLETSC